MRSKAVKEKALAFVSGIGCGVAVSVPGISWGTILVITGFYEIICEALGLKFKSIIKNWKIIAAIGAGLVIGIFGFSHIVVFMLEHIPLIFKLILAGLVAFGIPTVVKKMNAGEKLSVYLVIPALLSYALVVTLFVLEMIGVSTPDSTPGPLKLMFCAGLAGFASIIPGISGSFVQVVLGTYETVITAVAELDIIILLYAGIGVTIGFVGGSRLITYTLKKAYAKVYAAVLGLMTASVLMLAADAIITYA